MTMGPQSAPCTCQQQGPIAPYTDVGIMSNLSFRCSLVCRVAAAQLPREEPIELVVRRLQPYTSSSRTTHRIACVDRWMTAAQHRWGPLHQESVLAMRRLFVKISLWHAACRDSSRMPNSHTAMTVISPPRTVGSLKHEYRPGRQFGDHAKSVTLSKA